MTRATILRKLDDIRLNEITKAQIMGLIDQAVENAFKTGVKASEDTGVRLSADKKQQAHNTHFTRFYLGNKGVHTSLKQ